MVKMPRGSYDRAEFIEWIEARQMDGTGRVGITSRSYSMFST